MVQPYILIFPRVHKLYASYQPLWSINKVLQWQATNSLSIVHNVRAQYSPSTLSLLRRQPWKWFSKSRTLVCRISKNHKKTFQNPRNLVRVLQDELWDAKPWAVLRSSGCHRFPDRWFIPDMRWTKHDFELFQHYIYKSWACPTKSSLCRIQSSTIKKIQMPNSSIKTHSNKHIIY